MNSNFSYQSPLSHRYASKEMSSLFSEETKYITWRKLWIALAKAQKSLGIAITKEQIDSMVKNLYELDLDLAAEYENRFKHDVMAHIHTYGDICHEAKGIIHLGATSCFVTDNADLILMKQGLTLIHSKILQAVRNLSAFAEKHASLACLSYTHFQPAQPTTVGKRACLWLQDLLMDLHDIEEKIHSLRFLGAKGATGTQASFLTLFDGDHNKVKQLDLSVAKEMGFERLIPVSGQTYTRKQDIRIIQVLSSFAATAHKIATDIRLLSNSKEISENFEAHQVGSSAMPFKRNPIRSERICGLSRYLMSLNENPLYTASTQWLERTLDDSSNRRLALPDAFLTADAVADLLVFLFSDLKVDEKNIRKNLVEELPFMAVETILMHASKKGKDRQLLHERLRAYSMESIQQQEPGTHLLNKIVSDALFDLSREEIEEFMKEEHFIGRSNHQVLEFLHDEVQPVLKKNSHIIAYKPLVNV
ncbi:MAG: adenylosuccinate lyase [Chlamydiae bacterium]|nr:adenylosuccinate lyase [Chlamydiota bacterium]